MKEKFIKNIKYIIENEGACDGVLCFNCPYYYKYTNIYCIDGEKGVATSGLNAFKKDEKLLRNAKKWLVENTNPQLELFDERNFY